MWVVTVESRAVGIFSNRYTAEQSVRLTWDNVIFTCRNDNCDIWACPFVSGRIELFLLSEIPVKFA